MTAATRERLISAGLKLFSRLGIGQVGLDQVLQQAELTKTTFYNHFASKEELIREVIGRHEADLKERLVEAIEQRGGSDVRRQLLAVFEYYGQPNGDEPLSATLLINAITEFPSTSDPTRLAAVQCKQSLGEVLLEKARELGVANPCLLSELLTILLDGALINFQVTRDLQTLTNAQDMAALVIDRAIATTAG